MNTLAVLAAPDDVALGVGDILRGAEVVGLEVVELGRLGLLAAQGLALVGAGGRQGGAVETCGQLGQRDEAVRFVEIGRGMGRHQRLASRMWTCWETGRGNLRRGLSVINSVLLLKTYFESSSATK